MTYAQYSPFFSIENAIHSECQRITQVQFLDTASAALTDGRFTTQGATNADGTTSIMVDRAATFVEFEFKVRITTAGMVTGDATARAFVYATGTSCTYAGTPATQNVAITYPVTATVNYDLTSLVSYSSNDGTNCPLNQILWYYDTGAGVVFQEANPTSKQAPQIAAGTAPGL